METAFIRFLTKILYRMKLIRIEVDYIFEKVILLIMGLFNDNYIMPCTLNTSFQLIV